MRFLSMIAVVLSAAVLMFGQISQRVYLIPQGVEGEVYIFHSVQRGEKNERSDNTTTFRVPNSRFVVTQWLPDDSLYQPTFYYVSANSRRTQLEVEYSSLHRTEENLANKHPFVWNPGRSVSSWWSKIPCEIKYEQFYVGTRPRMLLRTQQERDNEYSRFQKFVESNVDLLCEGKPKVQTSFPKAGE